MCLIDDKPKSRESFKYALDLYDPKVDSIHCIHSGVQNSDATKECFAFFENFKKENNVINFNLITNFFRL